MKKYLLWDAAANPKLDREASTLRSAKEQTLLVAHVTKLSNNPVLNTVQWIGLNEWCSQFLMQADFKVIPWWNFHPHLGMPQMIEYN